MTSSGSFKNYISIFIYFRFGGLVGEPHCYFRGYAVYKFNDYIAHGTRQQYWEEQFTKAVMEGIQVQFPSICKKNTERKQLLSCHSMLRIFDIRAH